MATEAQKSYFIFNGIDTRKYGLYVTGEAVYTAPAYAYDAQSVDGREGDILYSHGRHDNVDVTYTVQVHSGSAFGFQSKFDKFRRKIASCEGYCQLTDGYNPDYIRTGYFKSAAVATQMGRQWSGGEITFTFSCKPMMQLASGMVYKSYPIVTNGCCTTTGLDVSVGVGSKRRINLIPMWNDSSGAISMRLVNCSTSLSVAVYLVNTSSATWSSSYCDVYNLTIPSSGTAVTVRAKSYQTYAYVVYSGDDALSPTNEEYLEICSGTDFSHPWRYSGSGICILNNTELATKPSIRLDMGNHRTGFTCLFNDTAIWLQESSAGYTSGVLTIDCENQTTVNEDRGESASKYVSFLEGESSVYAQCYPELQPGMNIFYCASYTDSTYDHDMAPIPGFSIMTREWTI